MSLLKLRYSLSAAVVGAFLCGSPLAAQSTRQITVGPNVHVSAAHANSPLGEIWLSADAKDPNPLLGCVIVSSAEEKRRWTAVYVSPDRGRTWRRPLETKKWAASADPSCAVG